MFDGSTKRRQVNVTGQKGSAFGQASRSALVARSKAEREERQLQKHHDLHARSIQRIFRGRRAVSGAKTTERQTLESELREIKNLSYSLPVPEYIDTINRRLPSLLKRFNFTASHRHTSQQAGSDALTLYRLLELLTVSFQQADLIHIGFQQKKDGVTSGAENVWREVDESTNLLLVWLRENAQRPNRPPGGCGVIDLSTGRGQDIGGGGKCEGGVVASDAEIMPSTSPPPLSPQFTHFILRSLNLISTMSSSCRAISPAPRCPDVHCRPWGSLTCACSSCDYVADSNRLATDSVLPSSLRGTFLQQRSPDCPASGLRQLWAEVMGHGMKEAPHRRCALLEAVRVMLLYLMKLMSVGGQMGAPLSCSSSVESVRDALRVAGVETMRRGVIEVLLGRTRIREGRFLEIRRSQPSSKCSGDVPRTPFESHSRSNAVKRTHADKNGDQRDKLGVCAHGCGSVKRFQCPCCVMSPESSAEAISLDSHARQSPSFTSLPSPHLSNRCVSLCRWGAPSMHPLSCYITDMLCLSVGELYRDKQRLCENGSGLSGDFIQSEESGSGSLRVSVDDVMGLIMVVASSPIVQRDAQYRRELVSLFFGVPLIVNHLPSLTECLCSSSLGRALHLSQATLYSRAYTPSSGAITTSHVVGEVMDMLFPSHASLREMTEQFAPLSLISVVNVVPAQLFGVAQTNSPSDAMNRIHPLAFFFGNLLVFVKAASLSPSSMSLVTPNSRYLALLGWISSEAGKSKVWMDHLNYSLTWPTPSLSLGPSSSPTSLSYPKRQASGWRSDAKSAELQTCASVLDAVMSQTSLLKDEKLILYLSQFCFTPKITVKGCGDVIIDGPHDNIYLLLDLYFPRYASNNQSSFAMALTKKGASVGDEESTILQSFTFSTPLASYLYYLIRGAVRSVLREADV
eukprot:GHVN01012703.1.p1 GENE.GHVN01012703.1~~GHVN01012703.1.p1  ORF type:complete len:913 (+),score=148.13 GHVN01012703.1:70-2808(+)